MSGGIYLCLSAVKYKRFMSESKNSYNLAVCLLASGSKGNAIYISSGTVSILVDAGLSGIEIERRMLSRNLDPQQLDAIVVSHEHSDHIQGVGVLSRRYRLPVYMNAKTRDSALPQLGKIEKLVEFECGIPFQIKDIAVHPFSIPHDASDPAGFTISRNGSKIGIATDLGMATPIVKDHLQQCNLIVLEANHDYDMLIEGPYPWPLKQRIKSRTGHLSNEASNALLAELKHERLECVILAHLSETNNNSQAAMNAFDYSVVDSDIQLAVSCQDVCGEMFYLQ